MITMLTQCHIAADPRKVRRCVQQALAFHCCCNKGLKLPRCLHCAVSQVQWVGGKQAPDPCDAAGSGQKPEPLRILYEKCL